jgi:hypothetical protein
MRRRGMGMALKFVGVGLIAVIISACSSYPRQQTPAGQAPSASAAAVTHPVAAPVAIGTAPTANGITPTSTPAIDRAYIKAGYEAKMYQGQLYYCRMETATGTQFKRRVCLNEAQMRQEQLKSQEIRNILNRPNPSKSCTPMPQCGG